MFQVTIKKRLFLSNLCMILAPVFISVLVGVACISGIWYVVEHGTGLGFEESEDFFEAAAAISETVEKALRAKPGERADKLRELSGFLERSEMTLSVLLDGKSYFTYGSRSAHDAAFVSAAEALQGEGMLSRDGRNLYAHRMAAKEGLWQIYVFHSNSEFSYSTLKVAVVFAAIVLLFAIFLSVLLTNRFLTKFMLQKIADPLDILADGVCQIRDGNLDHRIVYNERDEFAPVCDAFNEMAGRLKASVDETQRQEESRRELMAGISHDLRSPLTSIQAYVEGLLDGVAQTPQARHKYLLTIKAKAEDIQRMVSQIFLFSKMDLEEYPVHPRPLRLDEEIETLLRETGGEYEARGLRIDSSLSRAEIFADPTELRRVLTNVLDNAAKYKTAAQGRMTVELRPEGEGFLLTMTDDGPGVPEEALPKLFELFYRSDPARRDPRQGSGLGLAIAAKAISRMGGVISAENAAGGGLAILIWLPGKGNAHE